MGLEFSMWRMKLSRMKKLLTSEEACMVFLDDQFPDPDKDCLDDDGNQQKVKYSVDPEDNGIYLGKSWHLLHYLITGNDESSHSLLDHAIMEGHPIDGLGEDFCWLNPQEVVDIATALDDVAKKEMKNRSSRDVMSKFSIYRCSSGLHDDEFKYMMKYFRILKKYYKKAAEKRNAILRIIS